MTIKPIQKKGTTTAATSATSGVSNRTAFSRELHPIAPLHLDPTDVEPARLMQTLMGIHEQFRKGTLPMRQDPASAPYYAPGLVFDNSAGSNTATITQTIMHGLGRPAVGVEPSLAQGAPCIHYVVPNPQGMDPSSYVTVAVQVPAGVKATHTFRIFGA